MDLEKFKKTIAEKEPPSSLPAPLAALWWDAKENWALAHAQVDRLNTSEAMAVHAYLHRKEGDLANAEYWYRRAGGRFRRDTLEEEWAVLVEALL